jgi:hypothetical protein
MHQLDYFTNHKGSGSESLRALYGEFDMMEFGVKQSLRAVASWVWFYSRFLRALYGEFDMMRFGVKQSLHAFSGAPRAWVWF